MDYGLTVEEQNEINGWKDQVMADIKERCPNRIRDVPETIFNFGKNISFAR